MPKVCTSAQPSLQVKRISESIFCLRESGLLVTSFIEMTFLHIIWLEVHVLSDSFTLKVHRQAWCRRGCKQWCDVHTDDLIHWSGNYVSSVLNCTACSGTALNWMLWPLGLAVVGSPHSPQSGSGSDDDGHSVSGMLCVQLWFRKKKTRQTETDTGRQKNRKGNKMWVTQPQQMVLSVGAAIWNKWHSDYGERWALCLWRELSKIMACTTSQHT